MWACERLARLFDGARQYLADPRAREIDMLVIRENSEGEYVNQGGRLHRGTPYEIATQIEVFTRHATERLIRHAFGRARQRLEERRKGQRANKLFADDRGRDAQAQVCLVTKRNALPHWGELYCEVFGGVPQKPVKNYKRLGTPQRVSIMNELGSLPTRYWHNGKFDDHEQINGQKMLEMGSKPKACARCYIACGKLMTVEEGPYVGTIVEGPEFETTMTLGSLCLINDMNAIVYLNDLCDRLGIDTITAGHLVAMALDASDRGLIPETYPYGDAETVANILRQISARTGIDEILSKGSTAASAELGMSDDAIHVKNLEPAAYDPRVLKGMALAYATSPREACHLHSTVYKSDISGKIDPQQTEGKAAKVIDYEDRLILHDALIMCRFYRDIYMWSGFQNVDWQQGGCVNENHS